MEFLIGTGGWSYFKVDNQQWLKTYSEVFNFVEVNYTFYQYPKMQMVDSWRRNVHSSFIFSVRCHQDLTHQVGLKPVDQAFEVFYKMKAYCSALNTPYLVLETPPNYVADKKSINEAREFFLGLNLKGMKLIWEFRAPLTQTVAELMNDFNIVQSVDLSKGKPAFNLDVTYSRLFGKGKHNIYQFTDDELVEIDRKAQDTHSKTIILSYHGVRMNSDAARHVAYKKTGNFLPVTSYTGVDSAKAVLAEDAKFPSTKSELEDDQGWKVIDLTQNKRIHLSEGLNKIPDKIYSNIDDVIKELRVVL